MLLVPVIDEGVQTLDAFGPDIAAAATVAAVGTAEFDELSRRNDTQPAPPSPERI